MCSKAISCDMDYNYFMSNKDMVATSGQSIAFCTCILYMYAKNGKSWVKMRYCGVAVMERTQTPTSPTIIADTGHSVMFSDRSLVRLFARHNGVWQHKQCHI